MMQILGDPVNDPFFFQNRFADFWEMEVVGASAGPVFPVPCFDAHAATLAVQYPLLSLLYGDFAFDFGDCCCDVGWTWFNSVCSARFTLTEFFVQCMGVQFTRTECFVHFVLEFNLAFFCSNGSHTLFRGYEARLFQTGNPLAV